MIYGERIRYARESLERKLGTKVTRMKFAMMLDMTERSIANIENCKDGSKKLSFDKMQKIIEICGFPAGYFFYKDNEFKEIIIDGAEIFVKGNILPAEFREVLAISEKLRKP